MMNAPQQPQDRRTLKITLALVAVGLVLLALFLPPMISNDPSGDPDVRLPSMQNVPVGTALQLDLVSEPR